jgi:hypothetical protein
MSRRRTTALLRPFVEVLEGRWVPTTLTPTTFLDGGLGSGSLRDAVLQLNADTGTDDDIIQLEAGTYALTIQNVSGRHETAGLTGDLNLTQTSHRWIIEGAGPSTIIDASQLQDRVFQIVNPGTQVVFQDLVIQGGLAQDNGADGALAGTTDALGGGIFNNGGDLTLDNVILHNNVARGGRGGFYQRGYNARGGGLFSTGGALSISDSALAANQATGGDGGFGRTATYYDVGGGDAQGGGLYSTGGTLTIAGSTFANNQVAGGHGGSGGNGGDGGNAQGGGLYATGGLISLADSVAAANNLIGGDYGNRGSYPTGGARGGATQGGGLYVGGGTLTISNATIGANTLTGGYGAGGGYRGEGGSAQGGGLWVAAGATAQVSFSTIATNQATGGPSFRSPPGPATGGGFYNQGTLQTRDTILAGNTVNGPGPNTSPDVAGNLGSLGYNLVGNSQGGSGFDPTDLLSVDPLLGPLADNGGPTQTMALLPGSPAIDAGNNAYATDWDQRGPGFRRIVNGTIDIGAFEVQAHAHGRPTRQPLPDPVPVQALGIPGGTLLGQPPDLPADPSPLPGPGIPNGQTGQPEPVPVPTATGQQAPATLFGTYPGTGQPLASLGSLSASDLDALALNLLGGP